MSTFFNRLLVSFRIPLGTLTFVAFLVILVESYINGSFTGIRIFTLVVIGVNVIYLTLNKQTLETPPPSIPPTTNPTNGNSQEA